ncbi:MAG: hypothetical protein NTW21_26190 [Verrucomicrobia bacterium]|nr:hypothetical protein [Verrucomicrobiota bacterium]
MIKITIDQASSRFAHWGTLSANPTQPSDFGPGGGSLVSDTEGCYRSELALQ